jgi:hypothetical protein
MAWSGMGPLERIAPAWPAASRSGRYGRFEAFARVWGSAGGLGGYGRIALYRVGARDGNSVSSNKKGKSRSKFGRNAGLIAFVLAHPYQNQLDEGSCESVSP